MEVGAVQAEWYGVVRGSYRRSRVAARGHASAGVHFRTRACGLAAGRQRTQACERAGWSSGRFASATTAKLATCSFLSSLGCDELSVCRR